MVEDQQQKAEGVPAQAATSKITIDELQRDWEELKAKIRAAGQRPFDIILDDLTATGRKLVAGALRAFENEKD